MPRIKYSPEERKIKNAEKSKRWREKHKAEILEKERIYRLEHPEKCKEKQRKYLECNKEKAKENRIVWTEKNKEKIKEENRLNSIKNRGKSNARRRERRKTDPIYKAKCDQWSKDNKDKRAFSGAKRRARQLQATPKWLTKEDWIDIKRFYKVSAWMTKNSGVKHTVDHIIPLQGIEVSGLHVPWNLQVITDSENTSKGNRILDEYTKISLHTEQ